MSSSKPPYYSTFGSISPGSLSYSVWGVAILSLLRGRSTVDPKFITTNRRDRSDEGQRDTPRLDLGHSPVSFVVTRKIDVKEGRRKEGNHGREGDPWISLLKRIFQRKISCVWVSTSIYGSLFKWSIRIYTWWKCL